MKTLLPAFVLLGLVAMGLFTSSTRLVFSLPSYGILTVAALLAWIPRLRREVPAGVLPCLIGTGCFFGYVLLRTVLSPVEYLARADLFMVLGALMLYLLIALHVTSAKRRMAILVCLLMLGVANIVVGVVQFTKGDNFMPFEFMGRNDYGIRASGFYLCPNHLAGFLEAVALMGLSVACWSRWRLWVRLLLGYLAVTCLGGIIISGSRGGYVSTIVGLIAFALLSIVVIRKQNKWLYWRLLLGNLVLAGILVFGVERIIAKNWFVQTRAVNIANTEDIRFKLWQSGLEQFRLNPVWGTGSRTFYYYGRQFRAPGVINDPIYAHNDYLQLLAEFGVVGMLGFLLFLAMHLRSGFQAFAGLIAKRTSVSLIGSNSLALNIGALASVAAYMAHSFVDFNLHIPANTLLMAFVFGLLTESNWGAVPRDSGVKRASAPVTNFLRFSLPGLAIWMAAAGLATLPAEYFAERARVALTEFNHAKCEWNADLGLQRTSRNPYLYWYKGEAQAGMAETVREPGASEQFHEQAAGNFRKAIALFPQEVNFVLSLGWSLDALKRFDESEPVFLRALELDPNSPDVQFHYAAHLHLCGRRAEAEALYKKAQAGGSASASYGLQRLLEEAKAAEAKQVVSGKSKD